MTSVLATGLRHAQSLLVDEKLTVPAVSSMFTGLAATFSSLIWNAFGSWLRTIRPSIGSARERLTPCVPES